MQIEGDFEMEEVGQVVNLASETYRRIEANEEITRRARTTI
jgi:hypothetical protein